MESTRTGARRRRVSTRVRRRRALVAAIGAVALIGGVTWGVIALTSPRAEEPTVAATSTPAPSPTPTPTPLTPEEELLAATDDPAACAVSFAGDEISAAPMLQTAGTLYASLPIPDREGFAFAGWYSTAEDAASRTVPARVNGSELVACEDRRVTLHGSWVTAEENVAAATRVPILMYHQFTERPEGEDHWLRGNYAYIGDFDAHMNHIATTGFYLPTWDELSAFIDGRLWLPERSVIVTDDDADQTWFDLAMPVVDRHGVLSTSFMVTAYRQDPAPSPYVLRRSHTHDMHQAGDDGQGRIVNWGIPEIIADMQASADVLGVKEVVAYPFGHYNDTAKEALRQGGWEMARTIEPGTVAIGTDKLALPVVRIDYGMGLDSLVSLIG